MSGVLHEDYTSDQTRKERGSEQAHPFFRVARRSAYSRPSTFRVQPGGSKGEEEESGAVPLQFPRDYKNLKFHEWENVGSPEHLLTGDQEDSQDRAGEPP